MRFARFTNLAAITGALLLAGPARAQEMPEMPGMPKQMPHHAQGDAAHIQATYPRMGRAQENAAGTLFTLENAQKLAKDSNPTMRQAEAWIRAANARQQQAGLLPNPSVGYAGDEIRGGSINGGKQGFFVQQNIVTAGKLAKSRDVFAKEANIATIEAEEQRIRVESAVKTAFLRVLAAQELLDTKRDLAKIETDYAETQRRLFNTGQEDETELLNAEVEAQRMQVAARMQENTLREEWRSLAAVIGKPELPQTVVAGDLEHNWPELNEDQIVQTIAAQSPATRIADAASERALAQLTRAKREAIPDLLLRGGLEYNREPIAPGGPATGWEGVAEIGVQIPIFNRNQGNVAAASAEHDGAELEKQRIALTLRDRAATVVDQYANAKLMAVEYRDEILPRARRAYSLMVEKNGLMLAAPPRVAESQRKLYQLQAEYISALESLWATGIALEGYLLTDGLEAPSRPGEIDRPVRETNVPLPDRMQSPQ